jgi:hypothetical protein
MACATPCGFSVKEGGFRQLGISCERSSFAGAEEIGA